MMGIRLTAAFLTMTFGLLANGQAFAQDASALSGRWTGLIGEPRSQNFPQYVLSVHIDMDRNGRPVGFVEYQAFPCAGVWHDATSQGPVWRLQETITDGITRCARHVVVELTPAADGLAVRLWPVGMESTASSGQLRRRP